MGNQMQTLQFKGKKDRSFVKGGVQLIAQAFILRWVQCTSKVEIRRLLYLDCINHVKDSRLIKLVGDVSLMIKFQSFDSIVLIIVNSKCMVRLYFKELLQSTCQ